MAKFQDLQYQQAQNTMCPFCHIYPNELHVFMSKPMLKPLSNNNYKNLHVRTNCTQLEYERHLQNLEIQTLYEILHQHMNSLHQVIATIGPIGLRWDVHFVMSSLNYDAMVLWQATNLTYNHIYECLKVQVIRLFNGSQKTIRLVTF